MILKNNYLFALLFMFIACGQGNRNVKNITINQKNATKLFHNNDNVLLLSCVRCGCFIPALKAAYAKDKIFFDDIFLVTDTSCNSFPFIKNHVSQTAIDSISEEMYNISLLKKNGNEYVSRIIETEENSKIVAIAKEFFKK